MIRKIIARILQPVVAIKEDKDALFRGKILGIGELPLQTRLSSELTSFADIRRERDEFYINDNINHT